MAGPPPLEPTAQYEGKPSVHVKLQEAHEHDEPAYAVAELTKGFGPTLRRRVEKMDLDGDGTLDVNELKATLKEDYRNYKANRQMKVILIFMFVTLLMSIGATCGTTYAMVAFLKDAEVSSDGLLKATKHSGPVRTASARGSVHVLNSGEREVAAHVRLRRLQQSGNETIDQQEVCLTDCPVGEASCTQARTWFTMLQEETTVTDVVFQVTTQTTNILNIRAQSWSSIPATIIGHDTDESWGDSPPSYFVACPSVFYLEPKKECTCRISVREAVPVRRPNTTATVDDQDSSLTRNSTARRALASVLHPDNDHFMAAAVGDMVAAPLGQLPCEEVARLQDTMQKAGHKAHFTYTLPSTKVHVPISAELKAVHITSESETTEAELVLSVDLKLSALHTGIGHAKIVCPHANLSTLALAKTAALDFECSCGIFGTHGLALQHHKKLQFIADSQVKDKAEVADAQGEDQALTSNDNRPALDPASSEEDSAALDASSPPRRFQAPGGRKLLSSPLVCLRVWDQARPTRFPEVFRSWTSQAPNQIFNSSRWSMCIPQFSSLEGRLDLRYCQSDPTREEDPEKRSRAPGCHREYPWGEGPSRVLRDQPAQCWTPSQLESFHVGPRGLEDQRDIRLNQWAYYAAPALLRAEAVQGDTLHRGDRWPIDMIECGKPFETVESSGAIGPHGVKDGIQADSSTGVVGEHFEKWWNPVYIARQDFSFELCWHGEDGQAPSLTTIRDRLRAMDRNWFNSQPLKCAVIGFWEAQVVREEFVVDLEAKFLACFPASSTVWRLDRGHLGLPASPVRMDELRLGDAILTLDKNGHAAWLPVLFMGHASRELTTEFVELHGSTGRVLHASPEHLLMLAHIPEWSSAQALPAQAAKPGMYVFSVSVANGLRGGEGMAAVPEQIMKVTRMVGKGLFAPHTTSPDAILVVDGFAAHELTANYSMRQLSFLKWLLSGLHKLLGAQQFSAIHDWLHAQHFPELVNSVVAFLRFYLHPLGIKG